MKNKSRVYWVEPFIFMFFGLLHIHRIWGLIDRAGYADFWLSLMEGKGWFYFVLMGIMAALCVSGIVLFIKNRGHNYWWRWFYIFGGGYVIFDLFAIYVELDIWKKLLSAMFDTSAPYWNILWGGFITLGLVSFGIGISLIIKRVRMKNNQG